MNYKYYLCYLLLLILLLLSFLISTTNAINHATSTNEENAPENTPCECYYKFNKCIDCKSTCYYVTDCPLYCKTTHPTMTPQPTSKPTSPPSPIPCPPLPPKPPCPPLPPKPPCPPVPHPRPCGPCVSDFYTVIRVTQSQLSSGGTTFTFALLNNTLGQIICVDKVFYKFNCASFSFNQGTVINELLLDRANSSAPQSLDININPLFNPFEDTTFHFFSFCDSKSCQLRPGDRLLVRLTFSDMPFLQHEFQAVAVVKVNKRCTLERGCRKTLQQSNKIKENLYSEEQENLSEEQKEE